MKIFQTLTLTLMMALMGSAAFAAEDTGNVVTVHFNTNKNPTYHSVTFRPGGADTSQSPSVKIVSGNKQGEGQLAFWNPQGQITTFIDGASGTMSLRHTDLKDNASVVNVYAMKNYVKQSLDSSVANNTVINNRLNHFDQSLTNLQDGLDHQVRELRGGIAQAIAATQLSQATEPGETLLSGGASYYHGAMGYALGVSHLTESGRYGWKASLSGDSRSDMGVGIGGSIRI